MIVERLAQWCEARGVTMAQLAFRWLLAQDVVPSVIAGASSPAQIDENAAAVAGAFTSQEIAEIDALADNKPKEFGAH